VCAIVGGVCEGVSGVGPLAVPLSPLYDLPLYRGFEGQSVVVPRPLVIGSLSERDSPEWFWRHERFGP